MTDQEEKLLLEKEQEIKNQLAAAGFSEKIYEELKACGAINYEFEEIVEEVESDDSDRYFCYVTSDSFTKKKKSVKLCNPVYNIKNLAKYSANCASNISSAVSAYESQNWLGLSLALFSLLNNARAAFEIPLDDDEAKVIVSLWKAYEGKRLIIGVSEGFAAVNEQLELFGYSPMSEKNYQSALDRLMRIHAIDLIEDKIYLLETVRKRVTV